MVKMLNTIIWYFLCFEKIKEDAESIFIPSRIRQDGSNLEQNCDTQRGIQQRCLEKQIRAKAGESLQDGFV